MPEKNCKNRERRFNLPRWSRVWLLGWGVASGFLALVWLVLRSGLKLAIAGMALGVVISWWAALALENLLFQTTPRDLVAFVSVVGVMLGVSVLACLIPARRATRVDLVQVLKAD